MNAKLGVRLVPKLQLGNPDDEALASRDRKLELLAPNSQAGAWELARHFVECSEINSKKIHKTIINNLYTIAYPDPPYNFDHPYFDDLKAELTKLVN